MKGGVEGQSQHVVEQAQHCQKVEAGMGYSHSRNQTQSLHSPCCSECCGQQQFLKRQDDHRVTNLNPLELQGSPYSCKLNAANVLKDILRLRTVLGTTKQKLLLCVTKTQAQSR